jgi:hypothetical protein
MYLTAKRDNLPNDNKSTGHNSALKKCGFRASCKRIFSAAESFGAFDELRNHLYI